MATLNCVSRVSSCVTWTLCSVSSLFRNSVGWFVRTNSIGGTNVSDTWSIAGLSAGGRNSRPVFDSRMTIGGFSALDGGTRPTTLRTPPAGVDVGAPCGSDVVGGGGDDFEQPDESSTHNRPTL